MPNPNNPPNLEVLLDVPVQVTVELGSCQMPMRDVLQLAAGSVVQLDRLADQPVDLFVNNKKIAQGEVVVIEDRLGIKITHVLGSRPVEEVIEAPRAAKNAPPLGALQP